MPRREPSAFVWDLLDASRSLTSMCAGMNREQYLQDKVRRLAAERLLITIGEAMNRLSSADSDMATELGDVGPIVAFRNVLVHGYFKIDHATVWEVIQNRLPILLANAERVWSRFAPLYDPPEPSP
jgi:uncharacterized protein with HEPN domain